MLVRLLSLIKKEFLTIWKDPRSRIVVTVMPFIQMLIFVNAINMEVKNINLMVVDNSHSYHSRQIIDHFLASSLFDDIRIENNRSAVNDIMANQDVDVVVEIPSDFAKKILTNNATSIQVITDGRQTNTAIVAGGYISEIINSYSDSLTSGEKKVEIVVRNWFNRNLDYRQYSLVSLMALLSMISALLLTALSIAREKELGTFDQLIVSPLSPGIILLGKSLPPLLIAWTITCLMVGMSVLFFDFRINGSLSMFLVADVFVLLALIGVGLFISSLCKTQQQAILGVFSFQMPAILLSGFISPVDNMPELLQYLTYVNPLRFFMVLAKGLLLKDMSGADVVVNLVPLFLIAVLTLSVASWSFKSHLE